MELNSIVTQKVLITPELMILRVVPDKWELPTFIPGQFAVLGLPASSVRTKFSDAESTEINQNKIIKRAYSIASSSNNKEYIEFYITLVKSGALTPRLFAIEQGDRIFLGPKFTGMFTLDMIKESTNLVMLSTGTGLAPYMSMIRTTLTNRKHRQFVVIHGARHSGDLGYRSELLALRENFDKLTYVPIISRPKNESTKWKGHIGYIQDMWKIKEEIFPFSAAPKNTHVLLCGNPGMIDEMVEILVEEGYNEHTKKIPGNIHLERYW